MLDVYVVSQENEHFIVCLHNYRFQVRYMQLLNTPLCSSHQDYSHMESMDMD